MSASRNILFLPDAGPDNPFQYLLVEELRRRGNKVFLGKKKSMFTLINEVRRTKPDLIYFDWLHSFLIGQKRIGSLIKSITFVVELFIVKYVLRKKIIHTIHNIHSHAHKNPVIERFFYRWFLKQCDMVRVYDESTIGKINDYLGIHIENYVVSPDLPYTMHYTSRVTQEEAIGYFPLAEKKFVYLFVGNIKPYKGVEELIEAFSDPIFENDLLVLAGRVQKGDFEEKMNAKVAGKDNVVLVNEFIKEEDLKFYMALADVVVFPFRNIEHSGSVELAMTFGKAIITLKAPSILALLSHQSALLYDQSNDLKAKMQSAAKLNLKDFGERNQEIIETTDYSKLLDMFYV